MTIKIQLLETFVTVADCGSLAEASQRLHRTPSAISMALKQLEEHLGRRLFEADRKSQLTPLGSFVLEHARREIEHYRQTVGAMERYARGESGSVRVACVPSVARRLLPGVVRRFRAAHPAVAVDLRDMDSDSVCDALRLGRIDLGIASPVAASDGFAARALVRDPFGVVCSAAHPLTRLARPVTWPDLAPHDFILNPTCRHVADPALQPLLARATLTVHSTTSLVAMVAADAGVTVLPRLAVDDGDGGVRLLPLAAPVPSRTLVLLRRAGVTPTPAMEAFEAALEASAPGSAVAG